MEINFCTFDEIGEKIVAVKLRPLTSFPGYFPDNFKISMPVNPRLIVETVSIYDDATYC